MHTVHFDEAMAAAFVQAMGHPDPRHPIGPIPGDSEAWRMLTEQIGAGWFLGGRIYLFGAWIEGLDSCLEAWRFLIPADRERRVVGYSALGSLIVLEQPSRLGFEAPLAVLDPFLLTYGGPSRLILHDLFRGRAHELVPAALPAAEVTTGLGTVPQPRLGPREALVPIQPRPLGGRCVLENFQREDLLDYYRSTGEIYARHLAGCVRRDERPVTAQTSSPIDTAAATVERFAGRSGAGQSASRSSTASATNPATRMFAAWSGQDPDRVGRDPKALLEGLRTVGEDIREIMRDAVSGDPARHARAEARLAELRRMQAEAGLQDDPAPPAASDDDPDSPKARFQERLKSILEDAVGRLERLKAEVERGQQQRPSAPEADDTPATPGTDRRR